MIPPTSVTSTSLWRWLARRRPSSPTVLAIGLRLTPKPSSATYAPACSGAPEISSDAFRAYPIAIEKAFGGDCDYGTIDKQYAAEPAIEAQRRYSPAAVVAVERQGVSGFPMYISTSYVERQNLTLRMQQRRFTRLTNGFSKKLENHMAAVALYVGHYNFCRVH